MRVTRSEMDGWVEGGPVRVRPALQRMIVRQTSVLCADIPTVDFTSDLDFFFGTTLAVHVARRRSRLWLKHRRIARARRHMHAYFKEIMASRENGDRRNGTPDHVDDLLELHRSDPQFFPEENLPANLLLFLFGGLHLPGWERARVEIENYLGGLSGYRKSRYEFDPGTVELVRRECQFALDFWGYPPPDSPPAVASEGSP